MTPIGKGIVEELFSEFSERFEDDKSRLQVGRVMQLALAFWRFFKAFITMFFVNFAIVTIISIWMVDAEFVQQVTMAGDEELSNIRNQIFSIVATLQTIGGFALGFYSYRKFYDDVIAARREQDAERQRLIRDIVETTEEVLYRHKLIEGHEL